MKFHISILLVINVFTLICCSDPSNTQEPSKIKSSESTTASNIELTLEEANRLAQLPIECIQQPLPYKSGVVLARKEDLAMPQEHHPAFYGCFDWHSAVHGHWSLVYLLKKFPEIAEADKIRKMIDENLRSENIQKEIDYFSMNKMTSSFERTYGWAWLLKLSEELHTWDDPQAKKWYNSLEPLAAHISKSYIDFLPKLVYPIRVGEHSNTGFGLSFAYDYAVTTGDVSLQTSIKENALRLYKSDEGCPIAWEPSGYDFLSPCLQELDIMRKILDDDTFRSWSEDFLPELFSGKMNLEPGKIIDRSDGKLVHLDGLNFSRAWCLYSIKDCQPCKKLADEHLRFSLNKITDGDYAGQHWLASFALYAFSCQE